MLGVLEWYKEMPEAQTAFSDRYEVERHEGVVLGGIRAVGGGASPERWGLASLSIA